MLSTDLKKHWASLVAQTVKHPPAMQETQVRPLGQEDPPEKGKLPTPSFLPEEFHEHRSLTSYSPWGHKESDMTEQHTYKKHYLPLFLLLKFWHHHINQPQLDCWKMRHLITFSFGPLFSQQAGPQSYEQVHSSSPSPRQHNSWAETISKPS